MAVNGTTVTLTPEEKASLRKKIATFPNLRQFCLANRITAPLLDYPLNQGRCSQKTYKKLIKWKAKEE